MSKRKNILIALLVAAAAQSATAASLPTGYDEIRTADGTTCRASTASTSYLTASVYGNQYDDDASSWSSYNSSSSRAQDEVGVKVELVIPLGGGIDNRVDCSRFADLELQRMQEELDLLKKQNAALKAQQNTWD